MISKRFPLSRNGVKDLGNLCMPRSAQEKLKIRRGRGIVCAYVMGVCHSGRVSRFAIAHVGLGVEMCAGKVENTAWKRDCLRRCREKCGEVRREDNFQGVSQGLAARMSVWELRCVQGKLNIRRGKGIACADVKRNTEKCAWRMPYKAYVDGCLHTCRVKGSEK